MIEEFHDRSCFEVIQRFEKSHFSQFASSPLLLPELIGARLIVSAAVWRHFVTRRGDNRSLLYVLNREFDQRMNEERKKKTDDDLEHRKIHECRHTHAHTTKPTAGLSMDLHFKDTLRNPFQHLHRARRDATAQ